MESDDRQDDMSYGRDILDPESIPEQVNVEVDLVRSKGAVVKTVRETGSGVRPPADCVVRVEYTARVVDGNEFDSSDLFGPDGLQFTLRTGAVVPGLEVAVRSMRPGELARVRCAPSWAYGDVGRPPHVPPGAAVEYDVSLLGWSRRDLQPWELSRTDNLEAARRARIAGNEAFARGDVAGAGLLYSTAISHLEVAEEEEAEEEAEDGVDQSTGNTLAAESGRGVGVVDEPSAEDLLARALDAAAPEHGLRQRAHARSAEEEDTESERNPASNVTSPAILPTPGAAPTCTPVLGPGVALPPATAQPAAQRVATNSTKPAVRSSQNATDGAWQTLMVACLNNLALCHLRKGADRDAVRVCSRALAIEPANAKALYRRCKALSRGGDVEGALRDAEAALAADPQNKTLHRERASLRQRLAASRRQQANAFKAMFSGRERSQETDGCPGAGAQPTAPGPHTGAASEEDDSLASAARDAVARQLGEEVRAMESGAARADAASLPCAGEEGPRATGSGWRGAQGMPLPAGDASRAGVSAHGDPKAHARRIGKRSVAVRCCGACCGACGVGVAVLSRAVNPLWWLRLYGSALRLGWHAASDRFLGGYALSRN